MSLPEGAPDPVEGTRPRRGARRMAATAGGVVVLALLSAVAVAAAQSFYSGPQKGTRIAAPATYANAKWGYRVQYDPTLLRLAAQNAGGARFQPSDGDIGELDFTAASGGNLQAADQRALSALPASTYRNVRTIGPVPGAEIGFVAGVGTAYSATCPPLSSEKATSNPCTIVVISASRAGVTITVTATGIADSQPLGLPSGDFDAPFGLFGATAGDDDYAISNVLWKGES